MSKRARHVRPRSDASFERKPGQRPPRLSILIVCGGKRTEPTYFKSLCADLKLSLVKVEIVEEAVDPASLVERAVARREKRQRESKQSHGKTPAFDEVWCVFDTERLADNPTFDPAVDSAKSEGINLAVSNPAFEYWYLLHFRETNRPFYDANELVKVLKEYLPNYTKNQNTYRLIVAQTDRAIERAHRLLRNPPEPGEFPNPSTHVYKLVQKLKDMAIR